MSEKKSKKITDEEWENRILCTDESCVGTIGRDGRCRHCGLAYEGALPNPSDSPSPPRTDDDMDMDQEAGPENTSPSTSDDYDDIIADEPGDSEILEVDDDAWEDRVLCSDESCIGVIGPNDRCKECGKPR